MIPIIVLEFSYILILLAYFLFADKTHHFMMLVFVAVEQVYIVIFLVITLGVFLLFLRDDIYLIIDLVVLGLVFVTNFYDFIDQLVNPGEISQALDVIIRISRALRVLMFYFRMKSIRWKMKRLV